MADLAPGARQTILFVCPYHLSIRAEMEAMGFDVIWWDDRGDDKTRYKIGLRLFPGLVSALLTRLFLRKLTQIKAAPLVHVLIVKGEGMSLKVIKAIRDQFPGARLSLYFWDSVDNAPRARRIASAFDAVSTFDPIDARRLGWAYRPLFARREALETQGIVADYAYDWCFIGTLHSDRYRIVERLQRADRSRSFVFGFAPSRIVMLGRLLSDWSLWAAKPGTISTRAMSATDVARVCQSSRAMLDIEHPHQRGLTMRTVEALLSGRKLITTNTHIRDSDLFDESRVHVISRKHPRISREFLHTPFKPIPNDIAARYILRQWVIDLLGPSSTNS